MARSTALLRRTAITIRASGRPAPMAAFAATSIPSRPASPIRTASRLRPTPSATSGPARTAVRHPSLLEFSDPIFDETPTGDDMRRVLIAASAIALFAMPTFAADDIMTGFYGNTVVSTGGMFEAHTHYRADHTFD